MDMRTGKRNRKLLIDKSFKVFQALNIRNWEQITAANNNIHQNEKS
jgi:hypothetical protein